MTTPNTLLAMARKRTPKQIAQLEEARAQINIPPIEDRFNDKWEPVTESGCWIWTGASGRKYGKIGYEGKLYDAHRFSFMLYKGPIKKGLVIDHLCRNTFCVNPSHLEAVTHATNTIRGIGPSAINAGKTHCKRGHLFDRKNTRLTKRKNGSGTYRVCRACAAIKERLARKRKKNNKTLEAMK